VTNSARKTQAVWSGKVTFNGGRKLQTSLGCHDNIRLLRRRRGRRWVGVRLESVDEHGGHYHVARLPAIVDGVFLWQQRFKKCYEMNSDNTVCCWRTSMSSVVSNCKRFVANTWGASRCTRYRFCFAFSNWLQEGSSARNVLKQWFLAFFLPRLPYVIVLCFNSPWL